MRKRKRFSLQNLIFIVIGGYLIFLLFSQQNSLTSNIVHYDNVQQQLVNEKDKNEKLKKEKEQVNTDAFIEKKAREDLGYVKKNEKIFVNSR